MQTQDNTAMCYRRGNRKTRRKTSPPPSKRLIDPLNNQLGYTNSKRPSKPDLPNVPKPSMLLLQQGFSEPCLVQLSRSHNMPDCIRQASPVSFGKSPKLPKLQNTLYTLKRCWLCLAQISSQGMIMGERRRRGYNDLSLRMSSSLSLKDGCVCCKKPIQGFSL